MAGAFTPLIEARPRPDRLLLDDRRPVVVPRQRAVVRGLLRDGARHADGRVRDARPWGSVDPVDPVLVDMPSVVLMAISARRRVHGRDDLHRERAELPGAVDRGPRPACRCRASSGTSSSGRCRSCCRCSSRSTSSSFAETPDAVASAASGHDVHRLPRRPEDRLSAGGALDPPDRDVCRRRPSAWPGAPRSSPG